MEKTQILKKTAKVALDILVYVFIAVCLLAVILTVTSKRSGDDSVTVFGRQMRTVLSPSMEKCPDTDVSAFEIKDIPVKSMVFIETVPEDEALAKQWYADLKIGDVLTFKYVYVNQVVITHRITGIRQNPDGGFTIRLTGDNKASDAETLEQTINTSEKNSPNYIVGKVTGQSYLLGVVTSALKSPVGLVLIVILPSLAIAIWEILKIIRMFDAEKRKKARETIKSQQSELDELRQRLAALELKNDSAAPVQADHTAPPNNDTSGDVPNV